MWKVSRPEGVVVSIPSVSDRKPIWRCSSSAIVSTRALERLHRLAVEREREHPRAAASLREGMTETLTVTRLGITGKLKLALQSPNPANR
jgi:hypothetical protein